MKFFLPLFLGLIPIFLSAQEQTPESALSQLMQGHERYIKGNYSHPSLQAEAKDAKRNGMLPFAIVVCCSDARVPPEVIFDQGLGDLFVVRVAGNVIGPIERNSVEFAVKNLHVPLIFVLGHQDCKAVEATLKGKEHLAELNAIYPIIDQALKTCTLDHQGPNRLKSATECNVRQGIANLKASSIIADAVAKKQVQIKGGYYSIDTDKVNVLSEEK